MAEPLWTSEEIAAAVGAPASAPFVATGVSIDTRTLRPGDLFVALAGEREGEAFARDAFAKGAAGALARRPVEGGPFIVVEDTLKVLERMAAAARDRAPARRAAATGSVGKTGMTQAIAAGIARAGPSHAPVSSFNNHIGVPLTLARMPRTTERAVFELGMNHAGEIGPLSRLVRPHVAVVTTVGAVHTENFPDGEAGVARAKAEIFEGIEPGGVAVLNADNRWFNLLADAARAHGARVLSFGQAEGSDGRLVDFSRRDGGADVVAKLNGRVLRFPIGQTATHWGPASLAVLLALEALEVPVELGLEALADFRPLPGRGEERRIAIPGGAFTLIDESYNANPMSVGAALEGLGAQRATRRIAVLTDMLELGSDAADRHAALMADIEAARTDLVFCAGPLMESLWRALPASRRGGWTSKAEMLAPEVVAAVRPGDVVMVKGSKGSKASLIAEALTGLAPADAAPDEAA